jgi:hypothetical protein
MKTRLLRSLIRLPCTATGSCKTRWCQCHAPAVAAWLSTRHRHMTYCQPNWGIISPWTLRLVCQSLRIQSSRKVRQLQPLSRLNAQIALSPQARRPRCLVSSPLPLPHDPSTRAPSPLQTPPRHARFTQKRCQISHLQVYRPSPGGQGAREARHRPAPTRLHTEVERPQLS